LSISCCPGNGAGIAVAAGLLSAWLVPYGAAMGWPAVKEVWLGDQSVQNSQHVLTWDVSETLTHLATYPLEVIASTLPWCLLLVPYLTSAFRSRIGSAGPMVRFAWCALAVAWPTCWIPPTGLPRYFAPLLPCLAVLVGLAVERCTAADALPALRAAWQRYNVTLTVVMFAAALGALGLAAYCGAIANSPLAPLAEPLPIALAYAVIAVALAVLLWRCRTGATPAQARLSVIALMMFLVLTFTGLVMNVRVRRSVDAVSAVEAIRAQLPPGQQLVSIDGQIDSLFNYLYRTPIVRQRTCPPFDGTDRMDDLSYFCFQSPGDCRPPLPFAWQEIGVVNLDRNQHAVPERVLVVGRRLPPPYTPEEAAPPAQLVSQPTRGQ
jgi:uncharacterized membrane protein (DUF485 family)